MSKLLTDEELILSLQTEFSLYERALIESGVSLDYIDYDKLSEKRIESWNRMKELIHSQKIAHASDVIGKSIPHTEKCKEYSNGMQIDKICICFARQQNILIIQQQERNK